MSILSCVLALTAMAPSDACRVGVSYPIEVHGRRLEFMLESATYAIRYVGPMAPIYAPRGKRLLLANVRLHNRSRESLTYSPEMLSMGIVHRGVESGDLVQWSAMRRDERPFAPGSSVSETLALVVPNEVAEASLWVRVEGAPSLQYPIAAVAKASEGTSQGGSAMTFADDVEARLGEVVSSAALQMRPLGVRDLPSGVTTRFPDGLAGRHLTADRNWRVIELQLRVKNVSPGAVLLSNLVSGELKTEEGKSLCLADAVLDGSSDCVADGVLKPKQERTLRVIFRVPKSASPAKASIIDSVGGGRSFSVRLSR